MLDFCHPMTAFWKTFLLHVAKILISGGKEFHSLGPAKEKAPWPFTVRQSGSSMRKVSAPRVPRSTGRSDTGVMLLVRYEGAFQKRWSLIGGIFDYIK